MSKTVFYLDCPYEDKDECKLKGGKWDNEARKWYVPQGIDRKKFTKWFPKRKEEEKPNLFLAT